MALQADYMIPTDFGLSDERKMMIDMLKKFKEKECPKDKIGEWDEENHFPVDVWKKLGQEGILGACFPEEYGGIMNRFFLSVNHDRFIVHTKHAISEQRQADDVIHMRMRQEYMTDTGHLVERQIAQSGTGINQ